MIDLLDLMYEEFDISISDLDIGVDMLRFKNRVGDHTSDNSLNAEQKELLIRNVESLYLALKGA
jgi:hypothetical protein